MRDSICSTVSDRFRLPAQPTLVLGPRDGSPISVMRIQRPSGAIGLTQPIPPQDTFMFGLHLIAAPRKQMWAGTTPFMLDAVIPGAVSMLNLMCEPSSYIPTAVDVITFYVPRAAFDDFSDGAGLRRIDQLLCPPSRVTPDPVLMQLGPLLTPAMADASRLFREHIALALLAHLVHRYGGVDGAVAPASGGLAPWQLNCAKEFMEERLAQGVSLGELARLCDLSTSHFARAFRISAGLPPYRWFLHRRIERAKNLLLDTSHGLTEIALACGFADQSHFVRLFHRTMGTSPGTWRRMVRHNKPGTH